MFDHIDVIKSNFGVAGLAVVLLWAMYSRMQRGVSKDRGETSTYDMLTKDNKRLHQMLEATMEKLDDTRAEIERIEREARAERERCEVVTNAIQTELNELKAEAAAKKRQDDMARRGEIDRRTHVERRQQQLRMS